jgi:hypothetical protein
MSRSLGECGENDATVNDLSRAKLGIVTLRARSDIFGSAGPWTEVWVHVDEHAQTLSGSFSRPGRAAALPLVPLAGGALAASLFVYLGWFSAMLVSLGFGFTAAVATYIA